MASVTSISIIATATAASSTAPATATQTCSWPGHCLGAVCKTHDDCSDDLACKDGTCQSLGETTEGCSWPGHCEGATCSKDGDCDGDLACRNSVCAVVPGGTPSTTEPTQTASLTGSGATTESTATNGVTRTVSPPGSSQQTGQTTPDSSSSSPISTGAKIGIGVGVAVVFLLLVALAFVYRHVNRSRRKRNAELAATLDQGDMTAGSTPYTPAGALAARTESSYPATPATELPDTPKPHEIDSYPTHSPLTASELGSDGVPPVPPVPYGRPQAVELPTTYNHTQYEGEMRYEREEMGYGQHDMSPTQGYGEEYGRGGRMTYQGQTPTGEAVYGYDDVSPQSAGRGVRRHY
jgi:hypothetical protein